MVGNLKNYECLVSINNYMYKQENIIKAVDLTYKAFHVLNLKYPSECEHIWLVIQKLIYGMTTIYDNVQTAVECFLSNIQQI